MKARIYSLAVGKVLLVLTLVVLAGGVGAGIAAAFAYHQLGGTFTVSKSGPAAANDPGHFYPGAPARRAPAAMSSTRTVAAAPDDHFQIRYADYTVAEIAKLRAEEPSAGSIGDQADGSSVPPPLSIDNYTPADTGRPPLSDHGSHYIVDEDTGRVIGIDGSSGAAEEERARAAMQQPEPEVRRAQPVDEPDAGEVSPRAALYVPARKALPVESAAPRQPFSVSDELAAESPRVVRRALPVIPMPRIVGRSRIFNLPNGGTIIAHN